MRRGREDRQGGRSVPRPHQGRADRLRVERPFLQAKAAEDGHGRRLWTGVYEGVRQPIPKRTQERQRCGPHGDGARGAVHHGGHRVVRRRGQG